MEYIFFWFVQFQQLHTPMGLGDHKSNFVQVILGQKFVWVRGPQITLTHEDENFIKIQSNP